MSRLSDHAGSWSPGPARTIGTRAALLSGQVARTRARPHHHLTHHHDHGHDHGGRGQDGGRPWAPVSLLAAAGWSLSCHGTLRLTWQSHSPGVTVCSRGGRPGRRAVLRRAAPLGPTQKKQNGRLAAAGAGGGAAR